MNYILTSKQMFAAETSAVERGISFTQLMENAGTACAEIIIDEYGIRTRLKNVLVVCGKGKNGGDGFVIARKLCESGCKVTVLLALGTPKAEDAVYMFSQLDTKKITVIERDIDSDILNSADIIVDCIFGTGFSGAIDGGLAELCEKINAASGETISIDVPSGINCDEPQITGAYIKADTTIAVSALKKLHISKPVNSACGRVIIADIGIIENDFESLGKDALVTYDDSDISAILPVRPAVSNKGTFGHALSICGSKNMQGAAVLAANGALRMGSGLVTAAFPDAAYPAIAPKLTEPLMLPLPSDTQGTFAVAALPSLLESTKKASAVLIGCGLGVNADTAEIVYEIIKNCEKPIIIDADGINLVAKNIDVLKEAKAPVILTPHPGEMSRLCGKEIAEILADSIGIAKDFSQKHDVTLVLKGANTVVCNTDDEHPVYINVTGNTALAKGGSGDLLAGMMLSLLAQGVSPVNAARVAVYLHGKVADAAAQKLSPRGILPSDLATELPALLSNF